MVDAAPFVAVRYDPSVSGDPATTSAPAYDDVEPLTYAAHRTASPYTVLELLASRGPGSYEAARAAYERWVRTGVLVTDHSAAFYVYEEHELRGGVPAVQRGVLAAVALEPLGDGSSVLPHEEVDAARVAERLERLDAVPLDVSPVFAVYRGGSDQLRTLLDAPPRQPPLAALTDDEGTDHRIWAVRDPEEIAVIRDGLAPVRAVIADGHHRYATALAYRDRLRGQGAGHGASARAGAPWERTLMYLVDAGTHGPCLHPIHRAVEGLPRDAEDRLAPWFSADPGPQAPVALAREVASEPRTMGLWRPDGPSTVLRPRPDGWAQLDWPVQRSASWRSLPTALVEHVLAPRLGLTTVTPRSDVARTANEQRGRAGAGLLLLPPVDVTTVLDLAEHGEPMPAKTTSFRPKPRTGLVMRRVDA